MGRGSQARMGAGEEMGGIIGNIQKGPEMQENMEYLKTWCGQCSEFKKGSGGR